jgi:CRISPR system Cascade subunit CasA
MLNHLAPPFWPAQCAGTGGAPLWEEAGVVAAKDERAAIGFVESLTFPPRRVRLLPTYGGLCSLCGASSGLLVRTMVFGPGRSRPKDLPVWDDPWAAYEERQSAGQSKRLPVRPREDRAVWRDFTSLFLARGEENVGRNLVRRRLRPVVLRQLDQLIEDGILDATGLVRVDAFGLRTDMKAKVFEWRHDAFHFPASMLQGKATDAIEDALTRAEGVGDALGQALERLHPGAERSKPKWDEIRAATRHLVAFWGRSYWQGLEPRFRSALLDPRLLGSRADRGSWLQDWRTQVRTMGRNVFERALDAVETDADGLRRQERARAYFCGQLARITPATP